LEVPGGTRFVTCGYCSSKLEVHRSGGAIYTEVLQAIQRRTEELAEEVEILKLQNELQRIDREWQIDRESCMIRRKNGGLREPSPVTGAFIGISCIVCGIIFVVVGIKAPPIMLFGLAGTVLGFFSLVSELRKSQQFTEMTQQYEQRRGEVLQRMREFENARHQIG
jgi:hypothetical protein